MFESVLTISNWNPILIAIVFLYVPATGWWLSQTAYQNRWIADRENFRWSRAFLSLRTASATCLALGSLIVAVLASRSIADLIVANTQSWISLAVIIATVLVGLFSADWAMRLAGNSVHHRYPEEYDRNRKPNGMPSTSRPYNQIRAAGEVLSISFAIPLALIPFLLTIVGFFTVVTATVGLVITLPLYVVVAAVFSLAILVAAPG